MSAFSGAPFLVSREASASPDRRGRRSWVRKSSADMKAGFLENFEVLMRDLTTVEIFDGMKKEPARENPSEKMAREAHEGFQSHEGFESRSPGSRSPPPAPRYPPPPTTTGSPKSSSRHLSSSSSSSSPGGRRMSWTSHSRLLVSSTISRVSQQTPESFTQNYASALQSNVDQLKLLTFSNSIMMETSIAACLTHVIDAVYEAVSPDSCVVFQVDDNLQVRKTVETPNCTEARLYTLIVCVVYPNTHPPSPLPNTPPSPQFMSEFRHPAYRDTRPPRLLTTRSGLGQKVLTCDSKWLYFTDTSAELGASLLPETCPTYPYINDNEEADEDAGFGGCFKPYGSVVYTAIHDHTGRPLAVVETSSRATDAFDPHLLKILRAISLIAASAMRSARLHEEMASARKHSDALLEISQAVSGEIDSLDVIERILKVAEDVLNPEKVYLYLLDKESGELVNTEEVEEDGMMVEERIKLGCGVEGFVAESGELYQSDDTKSCDTFRSVTREQNHSSLRNRRKNTNTTNVICCPVNDPELNVLAVIKAVNKCNSEGLATNFSPEDSTIMQAIADSAGVALHKANLHEEIMIEQRKNKSLIRVMKAVNKSKENVDELVQVRQDTYIIGHTCSSLTRCSRTWWR